MKNASGRKDGDLDDLGAGSDYGSGGPETERAGAMTSHWPSSRLNLFPSTSETLLFALGWTLCFAQLAMGYTNLPLFPQWVCHR